MVTDDMVEKACRANIHPDSDPSDTERRKMRAALEAALSAAEPVSYQRKTVYGWREVDSADIPHYRSVGQEIRGLYAAPPAPSVAVKALEWSPWPGNDQTKNGQSGRRIMRRADGAGVTYSLERVEPQSEWFYIPPGQVAGDWYVMKFWNEVAGPFKTDLEALEWCRQDHETRIRSALSAQVQDVAAGVMASIAEERKRQIAKGYDVSHDDAHDTYEIIDASWGAAARINIARSFRDQHNISGYKSALIQAAAQIVAEIERLDRAAAPAKQEGGE